MEKRNQFQKLAISALIVIAVTLLLAGIIGGDVIYTM